MYKTNLPRNFKEGTADFLFLLSWLFSSFSLPWLTRTQVNPGPLLLPMDFVSLALVESMMQRYSILQKHPLSVFFPSQHEGNVTVIRHPPPQAAFGNPGVSEPVQGAPPKGFCCMLDSHLQHRPFGTLLASRFIGSPTSMRKPWHEDQLEYHQHEVRDVIPWERP